MAKPSFYVDNFTTERLVNIRDMYRRATMLVMEELRNGKFKELQEIMDLIARRDETLKCAVNISIALLVHCK